MPPEANAGGRPNTAVRGPQDFIPWLEARRGEIPWRFHFQRKRHLVHVFLEGLHPAISITVRANALLVTVEQHKEIMDALLWLEISPERRGNAYICTLCNPESAKPFASLAEMRQDHLYTPFLDWCQQTLAHATHLELLRAPGVTSAKLVNNGGQQNPHKAVTVSGIAASDVFQTVKLELFASGSRP